MNVYIFHWRDGQDQTLTGDTAADALNRAGYGRGAIAALDYYEHTYEGNTFLADAGSLKRMGMKTFGLVALVVIALITAGCSRDDGMNAQQQWCHDKGGYIANTGWYEWKCIINGNPVYMPSPRDGG